MSMDSTKPTVAISQAGTDNVVVTGGLTDTQLRATPVPVSGTVTAAGGATAANQATEIAGLASIDAGIAALETAALTDAQLRAVPVPVSGTVATGGLTDTQLRATPVPVSGTVATGALTDAQLRAADVKATLDGELVVLGAGTAAFGKLAANSGVDIGDVDVTSLPALAAGTNAIGKLAANSGVDIGDVDVLTLPTIGQLPAALAAGGGLKVEGVAGGVAVPISVASVPSHAVTNAGTFAVQDAALKAALSVTALQVTANGDTTLLASGTRKIHRIEFSNTHATVACVAGIKIASLNGGATFGKKPLPALVGQGVITFAGGYLQETAETVVVNLSILSQVEVTIYYE